MHVQTPDKHTAQRPTLAAIDLGYHEVSVCMVVYTIPMGKIVIGTTRY